MWAVPRFKEALVKTSTRSRIPLPAAAIAAVAMLTAARAGAQMRYYVDPVAGSNGNPGTAAFPLQTFGVAVSLAASNDEIVLMPGIYGAANGETFPITIGSPNTQNNLLVRGLDGVVFDLGGSTVPALRLASGANGLRITNISFINSDQLGWWTRVIDSGTGVNSGNAANNVEIDRCRFASVNRGMVLWTNDNVSGWRVHDNLFANMTNDAILEYTGTNNQFYNNTFYGNSYKAYISDSATSLCYNNLIVNCAIGIECNNAANNPARFQNNWIYQCPIAAQGAGIVGRLPASNSVGRDPLMVNPTAGDYHLQAGSPCIDAGHPGIFARMDLDAVSRIVDSDQNGSVLPEIGCHESSPVAMTAVFDPSLGVLLTSYTRTDPTVTGFVLFSLGEGLVPIPGGSPLLISPALYLGYLWSPTPTTWYVNLNPVLPFVAGTRVVTQVVGIGLGPSLLGGNRVWTQF
ncbi:MAG: hypothetical protein Fur0037_23750 [Planctomycetota bacterium]